MLFVWTLWRLLDAVDIAGTSLGLSAYRIFVLVSLFSPLVVIPA